MLPFLFSLSKLLPTFIFWSSHLVKFSFIRLPLVVMRQAYFILITNASFVLLEASLHFFSKIYGTILNFFLHFC